MKKLIFSSLVGLALVAFTGCTTGSDTEPASKCQSGKCSGDKAKSKKCQSSGKCATNKAQKCQSDGKCGTK